MVEGSIMGGGDFGQLETVGGVSGRWLRGDYLQ